VVPWALIVWKNFIDFDRRLNFSIVKIFPAAAWVKNRPQFIQFVWQRDFGLRREWADEAADAQHFAGWCHGPFDDNGYIRRKQLLYLCLSSALDIFPWRSLAFLLLLWTARANHMLLLPAAAIHVHGPIAGLHNDAATSELWRRREGSSAFAYLLTNGGSGARRVLMCHRQLMSGLQGGRE
jgi:hypothetical protein